MSITTNTRTQEKLEAVAGGKPDLAFDAILDIVDDKAWLRADGYLPGPNDLHVPMNLVRRQNLRRGDRVTGFARHPSGRNALDIRVETVNGRRPGKRPDFYELTAIYPTEKFHLGNGSLSARVVDLLMPIGKGQRALIAAPPKAGKTTVLKELANTIADNHPEAHIMLLLVDERPEEVTDLRHSVRGEVVAATFDRPPREHAAIAELAVERAKRLVEQGEDVVLLLDSLTRLGRAHNLIAPGRGRTLSGGLDSTALYPPKRLLGAARNIEGGGSLTIIASALVENGSAMDTLIFEELKSTGNAELKLDRSLAEARIFPAVDAEQSGTRRDENLLSAPELAITTRLRQAVLAQDRHDGMRHLLQQIRTTATNTDLLHRVAAAISNAR